MKETKMKKSLMGLLVALCASSAFAVEPGVTAKQAAIGAAVADSVSTHLALQAGAVETNPLVHTSVGGLVLLAGIKLGVLSWVDDSASLSAKEKESAHRTMTSLWGGVTANNLLLATAATGPVAIVGGRITGVVLWNLDYAPPAPVVAAANPVTP